MITPNVKGRYGAPAIVDVMHVMLRLDRVLGFSTVSADKRLRLLMAGPDEDTASAMQRELDRRAAEGLPAPGCDEPRACAARG